MRYFAKIRYLGIAYSGFQFQPNRPTVQGELNRACFQLFGVPCAITGCSRTDTGVHAEEFCLTIDVSDGGHYIPPRALPRAISSYLPNDISLFYAEEADETFHARYDVDYKEYHYRILLSPIKDPFLWGRVWQYPYPVLSDAFSRMTEAARFFEGRHDFAAFKNDDGTKKDTVRTIKWLRIDMETDEKKDVETSDLFKKYLTFSIAANGFLYNMVRIIAGTLTDVAVGRILPLDIPLILDKKDRSLAGVTAPPDGLYLHHVVYRRPPFIHAFS